MASKKTNQLLNQLDSPPVLPAKDLTAAQVSKKQPERYTFYPKPDLNLRARLIKLVSRRQLESGQRVSPSEIISTALDEYLKSQE